MTQNIEEPRVSKRLGIFAGYTILAMSSVAYGTAAWNNSSGLADQVSGAGMAAAPGLVALGALAAAMTTRRRRQGVAALAVGVGALGIQAINAQQYWSSKDAGIQTAKANLAQAVKAEARFMPTPTQPILTRISMTVEEGGPKERRAIRAERRKLYAELAQAEASQAMKTSLKVRVTEAEQSVKVAEKSAGFAVWSKTLVLTAIEALAPASMALSAKGRLQPQPQPQPAPQPVNPASNLAHMGWSGERGQKRREALRKAKTLNEAAI